MSELVERRFSNETGEFLFELSLSNITTIFECDIQVSPTTLSQYKTLLNQHQSGLVQHQNSTDHHQHQQQQQQQQTSGSSSSSLKSSSNSLLGANLVTNLFGGSSSSQTNLTSDTTNNANNTNDHHQQQHQSNMITSSTSTLNNIKLETNNFSFGAFEWSLSIVPLVHHHHDSINSSSKRHFSPPNQQQSSHNNNNNRAVITGQTEPICRVYLNRLSGVDSLCRVKYRIILGHHLQPNPACTTTANQSQSSTDQMMSIGVAATTTSTAPLIASTSSTTAINLMPTPVNATVGSASNSNNQLMVPNDNLNEYADSDILDQISDVGGRIRGFQFNQTNILNLISIKSSQNPSSSSTSSSHIQSSTSSYHRGHYHSSGSNSQSSSQNSASSSSMLDLRVHIEMFCANTISEARVPLHRNPSLQQISNCSDRNKQVSSSYDIII